MLFVLWVLWVHVIISVSAITVCYECYTCFTTAASVTCSIIFYISVKLFLNLNISTHLLLPKNLFSIYWLLKLKHAKSWALLFISHRRHKNSPQENKTRNKLVFYNHISQHTNANWSKKLIHLLTLIDH